MHPAARLLVLGKRTATEPPGDNPLGPTVFNFMGIEGGGYVTGLDHQGLTKACRTDVFGSYIQGAADVKWRDLFTFATIGYNPVSPLGLNDHGGSGIALSAQDPAYVVGGFRCVYYFSTDTGHNVTPWGLMDGEDIATKTLRPNESGTRLWNDTVAISRANKNHVLMGTFDDGCFFTTNFGPNTAPVNGTIPAIGNDQIPYLVAIAPNGTDCYIMAPGTGLYRSTTGVNGTFTLMAGSPTGAENLVVDQNGTIWIIDPNQLAELQKYASGSWSSIGLAFPVNAMAVDPDDALHIVVTDTNGTFDQSYDGGASWHGPTFPEYPDLGMEDHADGDVVWLEDKRKFPSQLKFNPAGNNDLWCSHGLGVSRSNPPATYTTWDWYTKTAGIREFVCNSFLSVPGNTVIVHVMDKANWKLGADLTSRDGHPLSFPGTPDITHAWGSDYAADDPTYIGVIASDNGLSCPMFSEDSGDTYARTFPGGYPGTGTNGVGGAMAINERAQQIIVGAVQNAICTEDDWATWDYLPINGIGRWMNAMTTRRKCFAADKERPGVFAAVMNGAVGDPHYQGAGKHGLWVTKNGPLAELHPTDPDGWKRNVVGRIDSTGDAVDYWHCQIEYIPGRSGELLYTSGRDFNSRLMHFTNDAASGVGTALGTTWGVTKVGKFNFGEQYDGQPYPWIFFDGEVNGLYGVYRSHDFFATEPVLLAQYPAGSFDRINAIGGDRNIVGRVYVAWNGSTAGFGDLQQ